MKRHLFPLLFLLGCAGATAGEQDAVRRAVAEGRLRPLAEILTQVQARHPGRVVDVELERMRGGRYVYEIEILTADRGKLEVRVDGASGELLERDGAAASAHRPLPGLLREAQSRFGGRVIDVELEHGLYQVELMRPDGRRAHLAMDPVTGAMDEDLGRDAALAELLPMGEVIEAALARHEGALVDGELERAEDGRYFYELEFADDQGREFTVKIDALTGEPRREDAD